MKLIKNMKYTLLSIALCVFSINAMADIYKYHADVKGMVCAYCAYSVSKNIKKIQGVHTDSVDVDLKGGKLDFISDESVAETTLSELFSTSGFSISNLTVTRIPEEKQQPEEKAGLDVLISISQLSQYNEVIEAIGNLAASSSARLIIEAPAAQEESLLKPLLMGRQQVVKIHFIPGTSDKVRLKLFSPPSKSNGG